MRDIKDFFWAKVKIESPTDCWTWLEHTSLSGYGKLTFNSKTLAAHRVSYELSNGVIPEGLHVCHTCDNKKCVNPVHLFLGSAMDNMKDKVNKSRQAKGIYHGRSKLDVVSYSLIKEDYSSGNLTQMQLASKYQVSQTHVSRIIRGYKIYG